MKLVAGSIVEYNGHEIRVISERQFSEMLMNRTEHRGMFLLERPTRGHYRAADNTTDEVRTESFASLDLAKKWLVGEVEVDYLRFTDSTYARK